MFVTADLFEFEIDLPKSVCPQKAQQVEHYIALYERSYFYRIVGKYNLKTLIDNIDNPLYSPLIADLSIAVAHFLWCEWYKDNISNVDESNFEGFYYRPRVNVTWPADLFQRNWNTGVELAQQALTFGIDAGLLIPSKSKIKKQFI
jgi:hypothetical protein